MSYSTAIHEAGHAVVVYLAGGVIDDADIIAQPGRVGVCHFRAKADIVKKLAIGLAGTVAEWLHRGQTGDVLSAGAANDIREAETDLVKHYNGNPPPLRQSKEFKLSLCITARLLAEHWGAVIGIANWLAEHKSASGRLCHAVVASNLAALRSERT